MGVGSARDITSSRPGGPISTSTYCRLSFRAPLKWPTWVCQRSSPTHECCFTPFFHHPVPHRKLRAWLSGHVYSSPVPPARFAVVRFACVTSNCRCNKSIKTTTISWSKSLEPGGERLLAYPVLLRSSQEETMNCHDCQSPVTCNAETRGLRYGTCPPERDISCCGRHPPPERGQRFRVNTE